MPPLLPVAVFKREEGLYDSLLILLELWVPKPEPENAPAPLIDGL